MSRSLAFCAFLRDAGFDFFTGVPDSTFKLILREIEARPEFDYVPAVSENVAVGLAVGAYLGGRRPVVLMQNSGLALALNPLASLAAIYRVPILLIVGWRGHDGKDSPEHSLMGASTLPLLEALRLPFYVPDADSLGHDLRRAAVTLQEGRAPCALVCRPEIFS
ncbi:MAG: sulfopyruvate decarboxylase subunit alpha [Acidobacteriota bacterium]|nr:sulfopyruvate decarboxylase subunit alpha [Acidobacteriota bacterium]